MWKRGETRRLGSEIVLERAREIVHGKRHGHDWSAKGFDAIQSRWFWSSLQLYRLAHSELLDKCACSRDMGVLYGHCNGELSWLDSPRITEQQHSPMLVLHFTGSFTVHLWYNYVKPRYLFVPASTTGQVAMKHPAQLVPGAAQACGLRRFSLLLAHIPTGDASKYQTQ